MRIASNQQLDGLVVDNEFYPFMVDGERNPALEWQHQWRLSIAYDWRIGTPSEYQSFKLLEQRWVAVGVKETNKGDTDAL